MAGADGSRVKWYYCQEDGSGEISATTPNFTPIRFVSSDLVRETTQIEDDEINPARQAGLNRGGTYSLNGSIVTNLSYGSQEALFAAVFQSSWVTKPTDYAASTVDVDDTDDSYNDSAATWVTDGFKVGDLVTVTGFTETANNVTDARITALTETKMTVDAALVTEVAGDSVTIGVAGDYLEVGETPPTFALLRRNTDTGIDTLYRRCRIAGVTIPVAINSAVALSFPVLGEEVESYTVPGGSTFDAVTTTERMIPTIGYMKDNAVSLAYLSDYSLEITNGMEAVFALFQRSAYDVSNGVFKASGSLAAYQEDTVLIDKFINETESDHIVRLEDPAGNAYRIILPRVGYSELSDPVSGPGKHIHTFSFSAGYDGVTTARLERIPV